MPACMRTHPHEHAHTSLQLAARGLRSGSFPAHSRGHIQALLCMLLAHRGGGCQSLAGRRSPAQLCENHQAGIDAGWPGRSSSEADSCDHDLHAQLPVWRTHTAGGDQLEGWVQQVPRQKQKG